MAMHRSKALLASAKGETCVACGNTENVVWAHCNEQKAGKAMGLKAHDLIGAYLCQGCHTQYDQGRASRAAKSEFFRHAFFETMVRVAEKLADGRLKL
jgi:hypothetical protein